MKFFLGCILVISFSFGQSQVAKTTNPNYVITSENLERNTGCWARLYEEKNLKGRFVTIVGQTYWPDMEMMDGSSWAGKISSVKVGPNAELTLYGAKHFKDMDHNIVAGISIMELQEVPLGDSIESLTLICEP